MSLYTCVDRLCTVISSRCSYFSGQVRLITLCLKKSIHHHCQCSDDHILYIYIIVTYSVYTVFYPMNQNDRIIYLKI